MWIALREENDVSDLWSQQARDDRDVYHTDPAFMVDPWLVWLLNAIEINISMNIQSST